MTALFALALAAWAVALVVVVMTARKREVVAPGLPALRLTKDRAQHAYRAPAPRPEDDDIARYVLSHGACIALSEGRAEPSSTPARHRPPPLPPTPGPGRISLQ